METALACFFCETPLQGRSDTWGPPGGPEFCMACWFDWERYEERERKLYDEYLKAEGLPRHWCGTCHPSGSRVDNVIGEVLDAHSGPGRERLPQNQRSIS